LEASMARLEHPSLVSLCTADGQGEVVLHREALSALGNIKRA
jgi:hypothetical protein